MDPAAKPPVREADQWRGSGGTGRFPQRAPSNVIIRKSTQEIQGMERAGQIVAVTFGARALECGRAAISLFLSEHAIPHGLGRAWRRGCLFRAGAELGHTCEPDDCENAEKKT